MPCTKGCRMRRAEAPEGRRSWQTGMPTQALRGRCTAQQAAPCRPCLVNHALRGRQQRRAQADKLVDAGAVKVQHEQPAGWGVVGLKGAPSRASRFNLLSRVAAQPVARAACSQMQACCAVHTPHLQAQHKACRRAAAHAVKRTCPAIRPRCAQAASWVRRLSPALPPRWPAPRAADTNPLRTREAFPKRRTPAQAAIEQMREPVHTSRADYRLHVDT